MLEEIEVKILNVDKQKIISQLEFLGAEKVLDARLITKDYDFPDGHLSRAHLRYRVRYGGKSAVLCSKRRIESDVYKKREKRNLEGSFDDACDILEGLGLVCVSEVHKDRTSFVFKGIRYGINQLPKIPAYVEVESVGNEDFVKKGVELLGYKMSDTTNLNEKEVLKKFYGIDLNKEHILKF